MELPKAISSIVDRINQSGAKWKAIYGGLWTYANSVKKDFENTAHWDEKIIMTNLPAFKKVTRKYTPHEYYLLLTSLDPYITFTHLVTLFAMFEDLVSETKKLPSLSNGFEVKDVLDDIQLKELRLAKRTRNCYIHNGSKIDYKWLKAYAAARGKPIASKGDDLGEGINIYHRAEDWHKLIVFAANEIKAKISNI